MGSKNVFNIMCIYIVCIGQTEIDQEMSFLTNVFLKLRLLLTYFVCVHFSSTPSAPSPALLLENDTADKQ